jgi:hypothetical protein
MKPVLPQVFALPGLSARNAGVFDEVTFLDKPSFISNWKDPCT